MSPHEEALSNLIWAGMPFRGALKGEARAAFVAALTAGSEALVRGHFKPPEQAPQSAREAAVEMHRRCLDACAALGVKPHELVPHFNAAAEGGFNAWGSPADALTLLGRHVHRTANQHLTAKKEDAA